MKPKFSNTSHIAGKAVSLWCIHGNLQLPAVWDQFQGKIDICDNAGRILVLSMKKVNLWSSLADSMVQWATTFCNAVSESAAETKPYLLGYSLGGRLALHAAIRFPELFRGIIVVSADPGLKNKKSRQMQLARDKDWASRFFSEQWDEVVKAWDNQAVFKGSGNIAYRHESDYSREQIAKLFDCYSKGRQNNLNLALRKLDGPPILYISGEYDERYCEIGRELSQKCPTVCHQIIERAGHRAPWDNPYRFVKVVQDFISNVEMCC